MKNRVDFTAAVENEMEWRLPSLSVNEGIARAGVALFCAQLNPTALELADIKCAVSEAVTNCIVHAYRDTVGEIRITGMRNCRRQAGARASFHHRRGGGEKRHGIYRYGKLLRRASRQQPSGKGNDGHPAQAST